MSLATLRQQLATVIAPHLPAGTGGGISTGIAALDAALSNGGLPFGRLTEIVGRRGSGKTTLVREIVAQALADKRWVAYVDAGRALAPTDWAALASTERLWIVRPPPATPLLPSAASADEERGLSMAHAPWCADILLRSGAFGLVVLDGAGPLAHGVAIRLTRLARESQAAFVVLREEDEMGGVPGDERNGGRGGGRGRGGAGSGLVGGAVRLRVRRRERGERSSAERSSAERSSAERSNGERRPREESGNDRSHPGAREYWASLGRRLAGAEAGGREGAAAALGRDRGLRPAGRSPMVLQVSVEKGGTHHVVEVGCAIEVARRLCTHSQIPDRRGVAARNRRGDRITPDTAGGRSATPPPDGVGGGRGRIPALRATPGTHAGDNAGSHTGSWGGTLAHKRRCAEPAIRRDGFLLSPGEAHRKRSSPDLA